MPDKSEFQVVENQTNLTNKNVNNPYGGVDSFLSNVSNFQIIESTLRGEFLIKVTHKFCKLIGRSF